MEDLAGAEDQARHGVAVGRARVVDHGLEAALREVLERGGRALGAQQALRREDDERPLAVGEGLLAEQVEVVGRRRAVGHPDVVLGGRLQEALDARRGVLGAVALVAVRQQHREPRRLAPLGAPRDDELVDHDLGAVGEVAVLGLPEHERLGRLGAVAVLEADRGGLRQRAVVQLERGRRAQQVGHRRVDAPGVRRPGLALAHVVELEVALAERAAGRVLAGQADGHALGEQRRERERLGVAPGDAAVLAERLAAAVELGHQLRVDGEARRAPSAAAR